ncbi:MAG: hypothetical protein HC800_15440 [Phormidesmis sp. RL_2_1]|nr:hypothetical protein [Phormidesmis sp. RL_2_1]
MKSLSSDEKGLLKQLLDEEVSTSQATIHAIHPNYPLRGLPLVIADDFDEPMPELWEALNP